MNTQNDNLKQIDSGEKITLTMTKISENMSFLFSDIDEAICQLNDNVLEKTINNSSTIVNMSNMFFQCLSLKSIPDISKINTENVIDISNMFYGCSNLENIPDKIENMKGLFQKCSNLLSIPDISDWNISNVIDISYFFVDVDL